MRKLKLFALAALIGTTGLFAMEGSPDDTSKKDVRSQIVSLLDNPEFATDKDFKVDIKFTFNSEGEIVVLHVNSTNKDVKEYIRTHINYKKLENPGVRNTIYTMPLKIEAS